MDIYIWTIPTKRKKGNGLRDSGRKGPGHPSAPGLPHPVMVRPRGCPRTGRSRGAGQSIRLGVTRPLRKRRGDSLFLVKQFFLSGEVQENLSLLGCRSELKRREQAGAVILALAAEHAEDGVQHLAGDRHQSLQFGFVAGQQILVKGTQVGIVAHRD